MAEGIKKIMPQKIKKHRKRKTTGLREKYNKSSFECVKFPGIRSMLRFPETAENVVLALLRSLD